MNGFYKVISAVVGVASIALMAACGTYNPASTALQTPIATQTLTQGSVDSSPEPIKQTLEERVFSELSPVLYQGELTLSKLYRTLAEGMGYSGTYPPLIEDKSTLEVNAKIDSLLIEHDLRVQFGLIHDYIIPNSLTENSISIPVQVDIQLYSNLHGVIKSRLLKEYGEQEIPQREFNNKIINYLSFLVRDTVGHNRTIDLAHKLISTLKEEFNVLPKNMGNSV